MGGHDSNGRQIYHVGTRSGVSYNWGRENRAGRFLPYAFALPGELAGEAESIKIPRANAPRNPTDGRRIFFVFPPSPALWTSFAAWGRIRRPCLD
jgi:hypothetical protein